MKTSIYRHGMVHVLSRQCETCIFRPGNKMELQDGRVTEMVKRCLKKDIAIICHDTMDDKRKHAVCRGFFNLHWRDVFPLRLAVGIKRIKYIAPPAEEKH